MFIKGKNKVMILSLVSSFFILSACMPSKIQEEISETEKKNAEMKEIEKEKNKSEEEITPENVELSKEQLKILENLEKKEPTEALFENDLDIRKELNIQIPESRSSYEDPEELSQYISYLFFAYHKGEIKPEAFLDKVLPHSHKDFLDILPGNRNNQIETFKILQETGISLLQSPIESYVITDLQFQDRVGEAMFYRKYSQQNGQEIYYITLLKKEDNIWKLADDSPAPPYEVEPFINNNG